jgi:gliding motility-associated-like protein
LHHDGCFTRVSVLVRVTDKVNLISMNDTTICAGDAIKLRLQTNGLVFNWTPAQQLDSTTVPLPTAITVNTTTYNVTVSISSCKATEQIIVKTVPYPLVSAGNDTMLCFGTKAQLNGLSNASKFSWSPSGSLNNGSILKPVASPQITTVYVLSVTDNKGCPKTASDSVTVIVLPDINAYAGRDTAVVLGQTIQLLAEGGTAYLWEPATGLSAANIPNPIASFGEGYSSIRYKVLVYNLAGCTDSAYISIRIFSTQPTIFVPTGFTPDGNVKNDLLRPIAVGMKKIDRFNIYNRYGQLVFSTTTNGKGWDGRINGQLQQTSSYVWLVEAVDYNDKKYVQKGTVTLIR